MSKLKLKLLLIKYRNEILNGNNIHLKDLIAIMVLLDLACISAKIESIDINDITLNNLINWFGGKEDKYKVPKMEKINLLKKKYKKELKSYTIPLNIIFENAATTWIEMMVKFGMIKEGQTINLCKFVLTDFMTDDKLISMFETNGISIKNYDSSLKR